MKHGSVSCELGCLLQVPPLVVGTSTCHLWASVRDVLCCGTQTTNQDVTVKMGSDGPIGQEPVGPGVQHGVGSPDLSLGLWT